MTYFKYTPKPVLFYYILLVAFFLFFSFLPFSESFSQILPVGQNEFSYLYDRLERYDAISFDRFDYQLAPYDLANISIDGSREIISTLKRNFKPILSQVLVEPGKLRIFGFVNEEYNAIRRKKSVGFESLRGGVSARLNDKLSVFANFTLDEELARDSLYTGKEWRGLAGNVERAIISFKTGNLNLIMGRFGSFWGSKNSLILSPDNKLDGLAYSYRWGRLTISYRLAQLSRTGGVSAQNPEEQIFENRYFAAHRLDIYFSKRVRFGLFETVVFGGPGRQLDLFYLNPLIFFHGAQLNEGLDDNTMLGFDFSIKPKRGWKLYGQLLVDDFQIEKKSQGDQEPDQFGLILGSYTADLQPGFDIKFEYRQVRNWMYNQILRWNRYTTNGNLIAFGPGNDYDVAEIEFIKWWQPALSTHMAFSYYRQGEGRVNAEWTAPWLDQAGGYSEPFPSGIIDRHSELSIGIKGFYGNNLFLNLEAGVQWRRNMDHIRGASATLPFVNLSVSIFGGHSQKIK